MEFSSAEIQNEASRLFTKLKKVDWTMEKCAEIAHLTLEINKLKKEKNAVILAHSYQSPEIMYGIGDYLGDSYGLSIKAKNTEADIIVFCSVHFMAETAKILNPKKEVRVPTIAGCSLAESIKPNDIKKLRKEHPNAGVICYVNTTAEVKAECDACCTSANALKIIEGMPQNELIFVPDEFMAKNLQPLTNKKLIPWKGRCIVHQEFSDESVRQVKSMYPEAKILVHSECAPNVVKESDLMGSTDDILKYVFNSDANQFMLVTECGIKDRVKTEFIGKEVLGSCILCPYMKQITLEDVLTCLKSPSSEQIIDLPEDVIKRAKKSIDKMVEITEKN
ncbi:quinolinate synthase NadA [Candidatus Peregrinibacteria bacterium]|nr:quinolinate synthase NadA [Candidatus Peregrinibacteria bacterium]